ncbi:MAG: asparagine synthase (glutamine-hydrolyzing), partial [Myxococcales bacterium]
MCGIAGAVGFVDHEVREAVRRATRRQAHRGPDGEGYYASSEAAGPGVAFGHRRLAVIDLSADGAQPMLDPESGAVIVYNGEVFNFEALRHELVAEGRAFRSGTDTEVVLQAYAHWGLDFVSRLRGMFALAIWDPRHRRLVLARDPLGVKPLYLARIGRPGGRDVLVFSSELRALLATGLVERRLDPAGLQGFLWHGFAVGPGTLVSGVRRLEPGVRLSVDLDDGLAERQERFWSLPPATPGTHSVEDLRVELEAAVRMQLVADVPLGVFLSGGVDSSVVMAIAARANGSVLRTFNVGFDEPGFDESQHARAMAQRFGTEHSEVRLSERAFQERLDDALGSVDQPTFDALNTYFVSRAAREAGLTVALAGTGGDELFGGYASFHDLPLLARVSRVA